MNKLRRSYFLSAILIGMALLDTAVAWNGNNVALVALAVIAVAASALLGMYSKIAWESLDGWKASTNLWGASQDWGLKQSSILKDTINDLVEHDTEAAAIHSGRLMNVNTEYLKTLQQEETNVGS